MADTQEVVVVPATDDRMMDLSVERISPSPWQRRKYFDPQKLDELAESIKANGLVQPIVVRSLDEEGSYELIAGERRLRAQKSLGRETITAIVRNISANDARVLVLIENIQREDLTPTETARNLYDLLESFGGNRTALIKQTGKSANFVNDRLLIVDQPREIQNMIDEEKINLAHLKVIVEIEDHKQRIEAAKQAAKLNLTATELRGRFQRFFKPKTSGPRPSAGDSTVKFNQVNRSVITTFEAFEKFDFTMLKDPKKREQILRQIGVLEKTIERAKASLAASAPQKAAIV